MEMTPTREKAFGFARLVCLGTIVDDLLPIKKTQIYEADEPDMADFVPSVGWAASAVLCEKNRNSELRVEFAETAVVKRCDDAASSLD